MERKSIGKIKANIARVIVGKEEVVDLLLTALLAEGHVLIDDVPGTGKTKLVNTLARSLSADFRRIQFTPDLQPADITGIYFYNRKQGDFQFRPGPIMNNIILADEINRAVPRTQSSLLEAMQERQVTIEGNKFELEEPFMVIATQNPVEMEGTFPLPEAQLDRFLLRLKMGYPDRDEEIQIMKRFRREDPLESLEPVADKEEVLKLRREAREVKIEEELLGYIGDLCRATREDERIELGVSPRGTLGLMRAARAYALVRGRDYVLPDDVKHLFPYISGHRINLSHEFGMSGSREEVIGEILASIEVPVEGNLDG
ncbi:MAG: AAA family ATPase [Halanaerobiaceae bacterium]